MLKIEDRPEFINEIVEVFEDFLEEKGIDIENPEKEGDEDASIIYGTDYGDMENALEDVLYRWDLIDDEN